MLFGFHRNELITFFFMAVYQVKFDNNKPTPIKNIVKEKNKTIYILMNLHRYSFPDHEAFW